MENKTGIISGLATIILLMGIGIMVMPGDTHYCEDRQIAYHCDSLTPYYGLPNGKCVHKTAPNKLCRSGWKEIDFTPEPEEPKPIISHSHSAKQICCPVCPIGVKDCCYERTGESC